MNRTFLRREFLAALGAAGVSAKSRSAIRAGCQTRAYGVPIEGRERLLSVLADLKAAGYEGFETNNASVREAFSDPAPLREAIRNSGVELIGLHMSAKLTDTAAIPKERASIELVTKGTAALGGKHVFASGPGIPRNPDGTLKKDALERRCEELNRAGKMCRDVGLRLCSHNHERELDNDAEEMRAVLARTAPGDVWILLDLAYVYLAGLDAPALVREVGSRVAAVHVRDMLSKKEEALPGQGKIDYKAIAHSLRDSGWSGWAILEMNKREDFSSREVITMGRRYMKDVMKL